jgi:SAM-dependent methyltransferase
MTPSALASTHALEAFDAFAPYYDSFTAHHDYAAWAETLLGLAETHGLVGRRLLDVACGTGKSALPFLERGFEVTAGDQSVEMLARARAKLGGRARLLVLDARELPPLGRFELITALSDVVNYMISPDELGAMFDGIAANLDPCGLVIFDANTLWMYAHPWACHASVDAGDARLSWECVAGPELDPGGLAAARLQVRNSRGREISLHYQRHHPRRVVEGALDSAGLEAVAVVGQFLDGRLAGALDERRHSKAIYVARFRSSTGTKGGE